MLYDDRIEDAWVCADLRALNNSSVSQRGVLFRKVRKVSVVIRKPMLLVAVRVAYVAYSVEYPSCPRKHGFRREPGKNKNNIKVQTSPAPSQLPLLSIDTQ